MLLTETQYRVLLEIGSNKGESAYSIAKNHLKMDQGGINRVCGKLRKQGLVSETTKTRGNKRIYKELKLTLFGFSLLVVALHKRYCLDGYRFPPELDGKVTSLLRNNRDLHEGLGIFYEYFSHYIQRYPSDSWLALIPLNEVLKKYSESYSFQAKHFPTNLERLEWDDSIGSSLYRDLFFKIWGQVESQNMIRRDTDGDKMAFFTNQLLPRFKESEGWSEIVSELKLRVSECEQIRVLKTLVD